MVNGSDGSGSVTGKGATTLTPKVFIRYNGVNYEVRHPGVKAMLLEKDKRDKE